MFQLERIEETGLTSTATSEAGRIARLMGLPHWEQMDDIALVERVRQGFPAKTAAFVVEQIDPEGRFFKATDIIPRTTLHRRKARTLTKDESEKLWALAKVLTEAQRIYGGDAARLARFLALEHPMLANRTPIDMALESMAGADLVLRLLSRGDAGVAA